jgi:AhpD family alkylhydroperoxidase
MTTATNTKTARIDYRRFAGLRGLTGIHRAVEASTLEPLLLELVKMRASQINGCGYCLDMHSKDARALGENEQRLYLLPAWRETTLYSTRERAALALTEAVTRIADSYVPDAVLDEAETQFDADELNALLFAIVEINAWNRLAITSRQPIGTYRPRRT